MEKNKKKKLRDIRNAVVMMCVMVAMMSTASYAWFSLTDSPTVAGMQMTAASTSGLKVAEKQDLSDKAGAIMLTGTQIETKTLKPVHPDSLELDATSKEPVFKQGIYAGNTVTGLSPLTDLTNYVAKYTYYVVSDKTVEANETAEMLDIGIIIGKMGQTEDMKVKNETPSLAGSFVRPNPTQSSSPEPQNAALAVRVGFVIDGKGPMIVWEPNHGTELTGATTGAEDSSNAVAFTPKVVSNVDGEIIEGAGSSTVTTESLFQLEEGKSAKVEMYVWLEGTDEECKDQIQASDIQAQVQFTIVNADTSTEP